LFLSLTSLTSILGFSTLAFFDFPWFEDIELQFFLVTTFIYVLLVFTQLKTKRLDFSNEEFFERNKKNTMEKLIMRNIYLSSSFYFFNLLFILTEYLL
tara:strand:+ start:525 stop:818 length:294 start_codon:yes stop_codon:yes gene_type:complete